MFELLLFDASRSGRLDDGRAFLARLRWLKRMGAPRSVTNAEYFAWWAGRRVDEVDRLGREWFCQVLDAQGTGIVHAAVRDRLSDHNAVGDRIVLVSGSFFPALDPLASMVGAHDVIASQHLPP